MKDNTTSEKEQESVDSLIEPMSMEIAPNLKKMLEAHEHYLGLFESGELSMIPKEYFGEKEN